MKTNRPICAAYVFDSAGLILRDSDAEKLDQLNYSFALVVNGRVSGAHWRSIGTFTSYIAQHPHIRPVLSIGGWGADGFSQAAASEEGRRAFAESAVELMDKHGFLGVDIDWEYPGSAAAGIAASANDKANFTLLLGALREALNARTAADGKDRMLSIAVGGATELVGNIDCVSVSNAVDQINLMTYDLQNDTVTSHHTPLYTTSSRSPYSVDSAVTAYLAAGVPARKLMIGAAFYGRSWSFSGEAENPLFLPGKRGATKTYSSLKGKLADARYDEKAEAAYLVDGSTFISFDSVRSIQAKGAYVESKGLMGMMTWQYSSDANGELLSAMRDSMR